MRSAASLRDPNDNAFYEWKRIRSILNEQLEARGHRMEWTPKFAPVTQSQYWHGTCSRCYADVVVMLGRTMPGEADEGRIRGTGLSQVTCEERQNAWALLAQRGVYEEGR